jgi:hypothetical protein
LLLPADSRQHIATADPIRGNQARPSWRQLGKIRVGRRSGSGVGAELCSAFGRDHLERRKFSAFYVELHLKSFGQQIP